MTAGSPSAGPRVALLTREYPPDVYGGAGVHVEYLSGELAKLIPLTVHRFGPGVEPTAEPGPGPAVVGHRPWPALAGGAPHRAALATMSVDLAMAAAVERAELVHSHTWYTNLAGHLARLLYAIPHVATVHSLEPLRPWKAEQLGGGYLVSRFCEATGLGHADAVIAVSAQMRRDLMDCYPAIPSDRVHVVHNGIDVSAYAPDRGTDELVRLGLPTDRPLVVFVGRITRQKGVEHLLAAAPDIDPLADLVLCAGAPDTPALAAEVAEAVRRLRAERGGVHWIDQMLARRSVVQLLSHAAVFVCPSVYEPLGIVNLEAMACGAPVVATATGGIPEVVVEGETGLLVPFEPTDDGYRAPRDPAAFAQGIADRVNALLAEPGRARRMGAAGRDRAVTKFGWAEVAARTVEVYRQVG